MTAEGYDYIVVGGGSSGCLVAGRLAEAGARVLVLEAGPDDRSPLIRMPAGYVKLLGVERYMWFYRSAPQAHLGGRTPIIPQGRVLGGGSSVNAMVYMRGQPEDYDLWAEQTGDDQWNYASLLPYFTGMEDNDRLNDRFHGIGGPWKVSDQAYVCDLSRAFLLSAQAMGLPFNADFNGATQRGVGMYQINARRGRRCSAAEAFLRPAMTDRPHHAENGRAGALGPARERPGRGRALPGGQRDPRGAQQRRGGDGRRGSGDPEDPDALRHRTGGAAAPARHRGADAISPASAATFRTIPRPRCLPSATAPTATSAMTGGCGSSGTGSSISSTAAAR